MNQLQQRIDAIEAAQKCKKPGTILMRTNDLPHDFNGQVGWCLGVGSLDMPKLFFYGISVEEVFQKAEDVFGLQVSAASGVTIPASHNTQCHNRDGQSINIGQVWKDCDPRRPNRYAEVMGWESGRVLMFECDSSGLIIASRKIKIDPLRMYKHSKGWEHISG